MLKFCLRFAVSDYFSKKLPLLLIMQKRQQFIPDWFYLEFYC